MSSVSSAVKPCGRLRSVRLLLPRITSPVRFVRPLGRETLVSPLKPKSRKLKLLRFEGRLKLVNRLWARSRLVNFVGPPGKEQMVREFELRSRTIKLVSVFGMEKLVRWLISRLSDTKLRAASSPFMLLTFRWLAFRFVRLSRSCAVKGPLGFCKTSRMAASSPGSGMDTV